MFLLNLTLGQLLALFGATGGLVLALYLLDRSRRRQTVATLRFWAPSPRPAVLRRRRRRIQQPLSLILQILGLACLLLALAQLRFGAHEQAGRDHVLILDTSAWMNARTARGTLMDEARALAMRWLRALPAADRVMLIQADGLATPATVFESNRKVVEEAIARSRPGATALDIGQALDVARQVQQIHAVHAGEIVFVGAGRSVDSDAESMQKAPPNLRVLPVAQSIDNCGLRGIGLRHSASDPALWEIFVAARNYGAAPRDVTLTLQFGGRPVGVRRLSLPPASERNSTFELRTRAAGWIEARLLSGDAFPDDDRAVLELPQQKTLKIIVYSDRPDLLRAVVTANPNVQAGFRKTSEYRTSSDADIVILDEFLPPAPPVVNSIWIEPPPAGSPVAVRAKADNVALTRWNAEHPLATGLRIQELRLESTEVFSPAAGDISVAEVEQGPVILARPGEPKMVVLGFHPMRSAMRYELATPLMFANILRWMAPELFRRWELKAGSAGTVTMTLDPDMDPSQVRVLAEDQTPLPFTTQDGTLRFFAGTPGTVSVRAGDREIVYSLTLPEVAASRWEPPRSAKRGIPAFAEAGVASRDVWQWLASLGGVILFIDWLLFGQSKSRLAGPGARAGWNLGPSRLRGLVSGFLRKAS